VHQLDPGLFGLDDAATPGDVHALLDALDQLRSHARARPRLVLIHGGRSPMR
jgi:hypothetical protein